MFKTILLPTDGSKGAEKAINCATTIALQFDCKIYVLFAIDMPPLVFEYTNFSQEKVLETLQEEGQQILDKTVSFIQASGVANVEGVLTTGHPGKAILDFAAERRVDLIVMGTHGRRGLDRVLVGSVAEEVVRLSPVPVLTVRMVPS
jgi:nucleotide-binding universal stress UspA family protein